MMKSVLNPEAPEFHPTSDHDLVAMMEEAYTEMNKATRTSNTFPIGASLNLFQTYKNFGIVTAKMKSNILLQCNQIMQVERPGLILRNNDDNESSMERVTDVNDIALDTLSGAVDVASGERDAAAPARAHTAAWNRTPTLATIQMEGTTASLIGGKNIPRPQLSFKEPVDNSDKMFVPRIHDKPNNIKPLALTILYNEDGLPVGYEHPYKTELKMYNPPSWALQPLPEPQPPPPLADTPLTIVDTRAALDALLDHLSAVRELAVDLEHHSYRTYQGITCLLQLSTDEGGDFIVDALALRDDLHLLNQAFTDPNKIKVFHGAEHDVQWLQRDFGVYVVGMFDTHQAARLLRLQGCSLKHLLLRYCALHADKTFQLADWRIRPLPAELVEYARSDTHYLLYVWRRMQRELAPQALLTAFHNSRSVCLTTYVKPALNADSHMSLYVRSNKRFRGAQLAALRTAWAWRDAHARELDESPAYLLPNHMLLAVAEALPRDLQGLRAICVPMPPFLNHHLDALHRIVLASRCLPEEPAVFRMPASVLGMAGALPPPPAAHDLQYIPDDSEWAEQTAATECTPPWTPPEPELRVFVPPARAAHTPRALADKKQLNAEARSFLPPFDRYRTYRMISQVEELKAMKQAQAQVEALGRNDPLIRAEVLRDASRVPHTPSEPPAPSEPSEPNAPSEPSHELAEPDDTQLETSNEVREMAATEEARPPQRKRKLHGRREQRSPPRADHRPYRNANYKRFHTDKGRKEHKKK